MFWKSSCNAVYVWNYTVQNQCFTSTVYICVTLATKVITFILLYKQGNLLIDLTILNFSSTKPPFKVQNLFPWTSIKYGFHCKCN